MSVDELRDEVVEVKTGLARIEAIVEEIRDRQRDEIDALFETQRKHEERLGKIEQSYLPREDHRRDRDANASEHAEFRTGITEQRVGMARLLVMSAILSAIGAAVLTASATMLLRTLFGAASNGIVK